MHVPLHLLMICHVLVRHRKHCNVCPMFAVNIHENGVSACIRQWVRRQIYIIWLTRMVLPLIPFRPFLQALVVRSVALKREFISIPRRIQNLRPRTRSDMCQSLIGIHPTLWYIHTRKLLFLRKICSLDDNFQTKRIFMTWLYAMTTRSSVFHLQHHKR
jgi:hypothetical protein